MNLLISVYTIGLSIKAKLPLSFFSFSCNIIHFVSFYTFLLLFIYLASFFFACFLYMPFCPLFFKNISYKYTQINAFFCQIKSLLHKQSGISNNQRVVTCFEQLLMKFFLQLRTNGCCQPKSSSSYPGV